MTKQPEAHPDLMVISKENKEFEIVSSRHINHDDDTLEEVDIPRSSSKQDLTSELSDMAKIERLKLDHFNPCKAENSPYS